MTKTALPAIAPMYTDLTAKIVPLKGHAREFKDKPWNNDRYKMLTPRSWAHLQAFRKALEAFPTRNPSASRSTNREEHRTDLVRAILEKVQRLKSPFDRWLYLSVAVLSNKPFAHRATGHRLFSSIKNSKGPNWRNVFLRELHYANPNETSEYEGEAPEPRKMSGSHSRMRLVNEAMAEFDMYENIYLATYRACDYAKAMLGQASSEIEALCTTFRFESWRQEETDDEEQTNGDQLKAITKAIKALISAIKTLSLWDEKPGERAAARALAEQAIQAIENLSEPESKRASKKLDSAFANISVLLESNPLLQEGIVEAVEAQPRNISYEGFCDALWAWSKGDRAELPAEKAQAKKGKAGKAEASDSESGDESDTSDHSFVGLESDSDSDTSSNSGAGSNILAG